MRPDLFRPGILAAVALLAVPYSTLAQTTTVRMRRLRSCGSFWPTSALRSIARLEPSRTRVDKNGERASASQFQSGWTLKF